MFAVGNFFIVLFSVLVLTSWRKIFYFLRFRRMMSKLPTLKQTAFPLLGHLYLFQAEVGKGTELLLKVAGEMRARAKLFTLWVGPFPMVFVIHPSVAEAILKSTKHISKGLTYYFLHPWLGTGLLTSTGEKWSQRRRLITPTFHFSILKDFVEVMNEEAHTLMKKIEASNGNDLDLGKAFSLYALDTICKTAMGESVNAQTDDNSEYVDALKRISELIQIRSRNPWMRSNSVFRHTKTGNEHDRLLKSLHSFTRSVIMNRMEHQHLCEPGEAKRRRMAFLDVLLNAETHDGEKLSASDIQEEVDTFMFEGHDTTACAMIWTAHLIGLHPCVQERAQAEIDAVFVDTDRALTAEDLKNMTYLEQVIKESLRMFPAVPIYTRTLSEDASFDGHVIPRGAAVRMDPYTIHHDPEFWPDPERFDPERFSKENSVGRHPFSFIPFSAGPRNCIGQKFAMQELKVVFSHLLRRYTLTSLDREETVAKTAQLVLRPVRPLRISVNKRC